MNSEEINAVAIAIIELPLSEGISKSVSQLVGRSVVQSVSWSVSQSISQSVEILLNEKFLNFHINQVEGFMVV